MQVAHRSRSIFSSLLVACSLGLGLSQAQALEFFGSKTVAGSGHAGSVKRELGSFHQVSLNLPSTVELVQGDSESVVIDADDNLLPLVETVVKSGELIIRPVKGVNLAHGTKIKLRLNARSIDTLTLAGSVDVSAARLLSPRFKADIAGAGSITIQDLKSDTVAVSIAGSGRFEVRGDTKAMDVNISGSGDVLTSRLSAQDVKVSIAGTGNAKLWVHNSLSISIAGSGDVEYYGEGTLKDKSVMGSARIRLVGTTPPV